MLFAVLIRPFSIVESEYFQALTLSNIVPDLLLTSRNTVQSWVIESYKKRKDRVRHLLQKARSPESPHSPILRFFDLWTSDNHLSFAAIVGHFMSLKYTVDSILLAFREHTGENIAGRSSQ